MIVVQMTVAEGACLMLMRDKPCGLIKDPWTILSVSGIKGIMYTDFGWLLGHCVDNIEVK